VNLQTLRARWTLGIGATIAVMVLAFTLRPNIDVLPIPARESSAIGWLRNLFHEQERFRAQHGCFASELNQLADITLRGHDYAYAVVPGARDEKGCVMRYIVTASPASATVKGARYFSIDETETLRSEKEHPTSSESPVLQ
jgi:hypothetical protein